MTPQHNAEHIASRIRQPLNTWPGNCFAIATAIVEAGIVNGRAVYGNYYGPIVPASMFHGKIVLKIEPHLREQKAKPKAPPDAPKGRVGTNWPWGD